MIWVMARRNVDVTVTATLDDGFAWGTIASPWRRVDDVTAVWEQTLPGASCEDVTPADPTEVPAVCTGGVVTAPTLRFAVTDDIDYSATPGEPFVQGQTVTLTATLVGGGAGLEWGTLVSPWVAGVPPETVATRPWTFQSASCTPVVPVAPTVQPATCTAGVVTAPVVEPSLEPTGVSYVVAPDDLGDGTANVDVTVTATLDDGFAWGTIVSPWRRVDDVTAVWEQTLPGASCEDVTPADPTEVPAVCTGGVVTAPTLRFAVTDDIDYSATPGEPFVQGQTVTLTATLVGGGAGLEWGTLVSPWVAGVPPETVATRPWTFQSASCTPVVPVAPTVTPATCTAGVVTAPMVEPSLEPTGVSYVVAPDDLGDGTANVDVTVTATLDDGYAWGTIACSVAAG